MQNVQTHLTVGTIIRGHYLVEGLLGKGSVGAVYLVSDRFAHSAAKLFALKEVAAPGIQERERFVAEGKALERLHDPGLPRVHDVFSDNKHGQVYIFMDYVQGMNLDMLRLQQPAKVFSFSQVIWVMKPIINALSYLHHQRLPVVHQNVKPANIILDRASGKTILVNFGFSRREDAGSTTTGRDIYSPYKAPEQCNGQVNVCSDIYGLGATIYTLLTGLAPPDALYRIKRLADTGADPVDYIPQVALSGTAESIHQAIAFHRLIQGGEEGSDALKSGSYYRMAQTMPSPIVEVIHCAMSIHGYDRFVTVEQFGEALRQATIATSSQSRTAEPGGTVLREGSTGLPGTKPTTQEEATFGPGIYQMGPQAAECENEAVTEQLPAVTRNLVAERMRKLSAGSEHSPALNTNSTLQPMPEAHVTPATPPEPAPTLQEEETLALKHLQKQPEGYSSSIDGQKKVARSVVGIASKQRLMIFILFIFLLLASVSIGLWLHRPAHSNPNATLEVTPHSTSGPRSKTTSTPVQVLSSYPHLAASYLGTLYDIPGDLKLNVSLTDIHQQQANISGNFDGIPGNGPFNGFPPIDPFRGTIGDGKSIRFILTSNTGKASLAFDGLIQSDGTIAGSYCKPAGEAGKCSDYGLWSLSPAL